jgi:hypothetical protein
LGFEERRRSRVEKHNQWRGKEDEGETAQKTNKKAKQMRSRFVVQYNDVCFIMAINSSMSIALSLFLSNSSTMAWSSSSERTSP